MSSFQGVGIEGFHCIQRCSHFILCHNNSLHTQNTVEHIIIPQVQNHLLRYVEKHKRDVRIQEQCEKFKGVTLYQLRVKPKYHSPELEPFINSISQLRYN